MCSLCFRKNSPNAKNGCQVCAMKTIVVTSMGFEGKVVATMQEWAVVSWPDFTTLLREKKWSGELDQISWASVHFCDLRNLAIFKTFCIHSNVWVLELRKN